MSTAQTIKDQIIQKAWEDAEFKKQLLSNPKAAVKEAFGINLSDNLEVEVVEESATKYYFVLPQNPAQLKDNESVDGAMWQ